LVIGTSEKDTVFMAVTRSVVMLAILVAPLDYNRKAVQRRKAASQMIAAVLMRRGEM
jgi:hypothetical protein